MDLTNLKTNLFYKNIHWSLGGLLFLVLIGLSSCFGLKQSSEAMPVNYPIPDTLKSPLGLFEHHLDVGHPQVSGDATYDENTATYIITGAGKNIWFDEDEFHFLYQQLQGDFRLSANVELLGESQDPLRKVGWMVRSSLAPDAVHASAVVHGDGLTLLQWRPRKGQRMRSPRHERYATSSHYTRLQLERRGQLITMHAAKEGEALELVGSYALKNLPDLVFVGLVVCSHEEAKAEKAKIKGVKIKAL